MPYENYLTAEDEQWLRNISKDEEEYQRLKRAHLSDLKLAREDRVKREEQKFCPCCGHELELQ